MHTLNRSCLLEIGTTVLVSVNKSICFLVYDISALFSKTDVEAFAKALQASLEKSKSEDEEMKDDEKKEEK